MAEAADAGSLIAEVKQNHEWKEGSALMAPRGGATPRVLGRQLPLPPPPPLGDFGQQLVAKGVALGRQWPPKAPDAP